MRGTGLNIHIRVRNSLHVRGEVPQGQIHSHIPQFHQTQTSYLTIDFFALLSIIPLTTMTTYNDSYSLPRQPVPRYPISIVDILLPGFSTVIQQLPLGDSNSYAQILCIYGIVGFLGRYAYRFGKSFIETYFSP